MRDKPLTIAELVELLQAQPDQHRRVWCTAEAGYTRVPVCGIDESSNSREAGELLLYGE